jgi:hypothetical protein
VIDEYTDPARYALIAGADTVSSNGEKKTKTKKKAKK